MKHYEQPDHPPMNLNEGVYVKVEVWNHHMARIAALEAALREGLCPRPYPDNKDEQVGWCVDFGQCGCGMKAALQSETKGDAT